MREEDGFAGYVERQGQHLVQVGYLLTGDEPLAREVARRALSRGWLSWGRLGELPDPDAYFLKAVVTSRALRQHQGPQASVPYEQRVAVVLRFFEALPDGRMAAVMDIPQGEANGLVEAGIAALGPADGLSANLRARADQVPDDPLLPAVRAGTDRVRRVRTMGAVVAGVVCMAVVVGVADLALTPPRTTPGAVKPSFDSSALPGRTWYLVSWTTGAGAVVRPQAAATLVFPNQTSARTTVPAVTTWLFQFRKSIAIGIQGNTETLALTPAQEAVAGEVSSILNGTSNWQITGTTLVFGRNGERLTYSSDPVAAQHG